jgi:DNA-binding NarL/FixJ family response regulator
MSRPNALSLQERTILELCADGFNDGEVAARLQLSRRAVSEIRRDTAAKLAVRIASAHPFHIREVVLARPLDSMEL